MKPVLFHLFGVAIPTYSVLMVLGYALALGVLLKITPKNADERVDGGLSRPQVWDLYIVMVVSSVIGSKFGHVLFEAPGHKDDDGQTITSLWGLLKADPWHWARLGEPGYVWYGGMIGALLVAVVYFKRRPKLRASLYSDAFAPAIMAGAAVGRVGCFFAGCCHGVATDGPWGVVFPGKMHAVHPTQLYDAVVAASLAALLLWRFGKRRFDGENIALLLLTYPVLRSVTEIFRGDVERGAFGPISTSQILSIPLFLAGLYLYARLSKLSKRPAIAPEAQTA
jgi:phosphatidylglycerol---prolipoprotein diacylglyceryl transferase